ncbi:4Fe-4S dicluster domain-containing protein [Allokutzneria albata]|uniref:4Fe-4S dicluster domain-containing protein n=1 Tax=Allokutzneria albata TaxID=211114 RepID=UPI000B00090A|nr:4Fe-4S dicluster domain-containing protein [Allokutzneria albata]
MAALGILDTVLAGGTHQDSSDDRRRGATFIIAVNCGHRTGSSGGQRPRNRSERPGRRMPEVDHQDLLRRCREYPRWEASDLTGEHAERWWRWSSCFELDFSRLHGGTVRGTGAGRYRQWISHKLSTWYDQFGTSGCVGCGRCIAWCPVGIDITAEDAGRSTDDVPPHHAG